MADETLDSLQIEITSSSSDAVTALNGLVSSLKKIDKIGKAAGLIEVQKQLKGIAAIEFENLSEQLAAVTAYIRELKRSGKKLSEIVMTAPTVNTGELSESLNEVVDEVESTTEKVNSIGEEFNTSSGLEEWVETIKTNCDNAVDTFTSFSEKIQQQRDRLHNLLESKKEDFGEDSTFISASSFEAGIDDTLLRLAHHAELLEEKLQKLKEESGTPDKKEWYALEQQLIAVKQQYQSLLRQTDKNAISIDALGKKAVKSTSKLKKLFDRFKSVLLYRAVRFLLSQITRAASEGLQNIAKFNESANAVMSTYKTEFLYMKNGFGSMLLPVLQSLLPTMIRIGDTLVDITNSIGMISSAINGNKTFLKAKKYAQDYANTLEDIKRSTTGFDELNILGKQEDSSADVSKMFEEVDISGWDIAESVGKLTVLIGSITTLAVILKGAKIKEFFVNLGKGIGSVWKYLKSASTWKKAGISIAAVAVEAVACYNGFYDICTGARSVGSVLLELIPICAIVGAAMYAMWGPVGIVIAAVVALTSAIAGVAKAQIDMMKQAAMEKFFAAEGVAISDVTVLMNNYFRSIGLEKQQEMNEKLATATSELIDARLAYDSLWKTIKDADNLDTAQIEKLSEAFNDLANATNAFNSAAIESAMASLRTGIEMNITPELTERLTSLVGSLQAAQDLIGIKVSGLNSEYQKVLNDVASGKMSVAEAKPKLEELRSQMNDFTLSSDASSTGWNMAIQEAIQKGVNAGSDADSVKSAINDLTSERDSYLSTLRESYKNSYNTLEQLIKIDKEQFGGALGFSEADLATLTESYNAQIEAVNKQFNDVIQGIYNALKANSLDYDKYVTDYTGGNGFLDAMDTAGAAIGGLFGWLGLKDSNGDTGWEHIANKNAAKEQKEFLDWILSQLLSIDEAKVPAHANGGVIEDGLFMANSSEIIGKFTNGKTVAANNETIVAGIKQGVSEAMQENGGNGGDWTIQIVDEDGRIKGETIITAAERKNRRDGKTIISVGG